MKAAIMQPYFFPYLGYISLLHYSDIFILFDTAQYDRKGWMHRNRILKPDEGWQYIRAGTLKPVFKSSIAEVLIQPDKKWCQTLLRQLEHYKKFAPFYDDVIDLLSSLFSYNYKTLVALNNKSLELVQNYLGIKCEIKTLSDLGLNITNIKNPGHWALYISEAVNATEYVNPPNGKDLFSAREFEQKDIKLSFLEHLLPVYSQGNRKFIPGLSIIDVMMFNSVDQINEMLSQYRIQ